MSMGLIPVRKGEVLGRALKGLSLPSGMIIEKRAWDFLGCRELDLEVGVLVIADTAWVYLLLNEDSFNSNIRRFSMY